jgi:hypothetical protein
MRQIKFLFLVTLILGFALTGCKTAKPITGSAAHAAIPTIELLDSAFSHSQHDYLSAKIAVHYASENQKGEKDSKSFGIRARFKKDSAIWLSITPALGIEMFRLCLTKDSVKLLNRLEQRYFVNSFDKANEVLKMNEEFAVIQALITGRFAKVYDLDEYQSEVTRDGYSVNIDLTDFQSEKTDSPVEHITEISNALWRVTSTVLKSTATGDQIIADYGAFQKVESTFYPTDMKFMIDGKGKIALNLKWTKIEEKPILKFPFKIPAKYVAY